MITEQFNLLREFANWTRVNVGKAANIDLSIWCHTSSSDESIEYQIWVEGLINKSSKDIDELVRMIPKFKQYLTQYCELNMELGA